MPLQWPFRRDEPETKAAFFTPAALAMEFGMSGMRAPGENVDYASAVRNGMYSSVITSALAWMMRTFPEAPCVVQEKKDEKWQTLDGHPLAKLLRRPNPEYGGRVLWMATIMDFCFGEAFWLKIRNSKDEVVELYWVPRHMVSPEVDQDTGRLSHYDYTPGGKKQRLDLGDVVHFRFGKDPQNLLRGFSPLASVMREVYIDDAAANFTAAILKNLGIIGAIFSPKDGTIPVEQAAKLKDYVQANFTGEKRGHAMMFSGAMNVQLLQYNLQGFDVGPIRDVVEERVSAALAIPAAVIGFGTGLQQTKVGATMREMVKLAWQGGIEPVQAIIADEMDRSLLTEFRTYGLDTHRTWFDTSQVEALTESPAERTARVAVLVEHNLITVAQAQRELGYPVDSSQNKYARELTPEPVKAPPSQDLLPAPVMARMNGNGNGKAHDDEPEVKQLAPVPQPISLAVTIEAPRAGELRKTGTMKKAENGEYHFTTTEVELPTTPIEDKPDAE